MTDDHIDAAEVTLAGETYVLKPSLKGIMLAAERHGITIRAGELGRGEMSLTLLSKLAYTGLLTDEPRLSYDRFVERIDASSHDEVAALNQTVIGLLASYARTLAKLGGLRAQTNGQLAEPSAEDPTQRVG